MEKKERYFIIRCDIVTSVYIYSTNDEIVKYKCVIYSKLDGQEEKMFTVTSKSESEIVNLFNQILSCLKVYNERKTKKQDFLVLYKINTIDHAELLSNSN